MSMVFPNCRFSMKDAHFEFFQAPTAGDIHASANCLLSTEAVPARTSIARLSIALRPFGSLNVVGFERASRWSWAQKREALQEGHPAYTDASCAIPACTLVALLLPSIWSIRYEANAPLATRARNFDTTDL